jgi:hypothetical protein
MLINQLTPTRIGELEPKLFDLFSKDNNVYLVFFIYAILHSVTLWGSIFFQKHQFIKTAFSLFIGLFILSLFNTELMRLLLNNRKINSAIPFGQVNLHNEFNVYQKIQLSEENSQFAIVGFVVIVIILWVCSFYRLKEKEV